MNSDLLPDVVISTERTGFFMEVPVAEEAAPYLVGKTAGMLWVPAAHKGTIRAAVRPGGRPVETFVEVVRAVQSGGHRYEWGNSFDATLQGLQGAVGYLTDYGIEEIDLLAGPKTLDGFKDIPHGVRKVTAEWVPDGCAVLVPTDRSFLGMVGILKDAYSVVLHNPARGMAILGEW